MMEPIADASVWPCGKASDACCKTVDDRSSYRNVDRCSVCSDLDRRRLANRGMFEDSTGVAVPDGGPVPTTDSPTTNDLPRKNAKNAKETHRDYH